MKAALQSALQSYEKMNAMFRIMLEASPDMQERYAAFAREQGGRPENNVFYSAEVQEREPEPALDPAAEPQQQQEESAKRMQRKGR